MKLKLPAVLVLVALMAAPAYGQTPMPDPLDTRSARRLDDMERVMRELRAIVYQGRSTGRPIVIEDADTAARLDNLGQRLDTLTTRIQDLTSTLTGANAERDSLASELSQTRRELSAAQASNRLLESRLATLETKQAAAEAAARAAAQVAAAEAALGPEQLFARARQSYADGDMPGAERDFTAFTERFPSDPNTAEANYWLGETLFARNAFTDASLAYVMALRNWPQTSWAPLATVKLARSLISTSRNADACQALGELTRRYPRAAAPVPAQAAAARTQARC